MQRTIILSLALLLTIGDLAMAENSGAKFIYQETTEETITQTELTVEPTTAGYNLSVKYADSLYQMITDTKFNTTKCVVTDSSDSQGTLFRRRGSMVTIRRNGQACVAHIKDLPWYQSPFALVNFIKSDEHKIKFYMATVSDLAEKGDKPGDMLKMVATKQGREMLEIQGQSVEAEAVTITLTGLKSLFWKIHYWYRVSDGMVVKYADTRGGPGTPTTYGILKGESVLPLR